jgi:hypothetical protein
MLIYPPPNLSLRLCQCSIRQSLHLSPKSIIQICPPPTMLIIMRRKLSWVAFPPRTKGAIPLIPLLRLLRLLCLLLRLRYPPMSVAAATGRIAGLEGGGGGGRRIKMVGKLETPDQQSLRVFFSCPLRHRHLPVAK